MINNQQIHFREINNHWSRRLLSIFFLCLVYLLSSCSAVDDAGSERSNLKKATCDKNGGTDTENDTENDTTAAGNNQIDEISLAAIEVVKAECAFCHPSLALPDLSGDAEIISKKDDIIRTITSATMPPASESPLSDEVKAKFIAWQSSELSLADDSSVASHKDVYDSWVKGFLETNCVSCHPSGDSYALSTYEEASKVAAAGLSAMKAGTMPKYPATVKTEEIEQFSIWVELGILENVGDTLDAADDGC